MKITKNKPVTIFIDGDHPQFCSPETDGGFACHWLQTLAPYVCFCSQYNELIGNGLRCKRCIDEFGLDGDE